MFNARFTRPMGQEIIVDAARVAAVLVDNSGATVLRLADGEKGVRVQGSLEDVVTEINSVGEATSLVVMDRYQPPVADSEPFEEEGESDEDNTGQVLGVAGASPAPRQVAIAPSHCSAIMVDGDGVTIVRVSGGRGIKVAGSLEQVLAHLTFGHQ